MSTVVYTKLGDNPNGARRLWLEGQRLAKQGITPGMTYKVETHQGRMVLTFTDEGDRTVSRKKRGDSVLPVIDINSQQLASIFGNVERVRVVIRREGIFVTLHHHERNEQARVERTLEKLIDQSPLAIGSLAHGGGILDHAIHVGLQDVGIASSLAYGIEIDSRYLDASLANNPVWGTDAIALHAPMEEVEADKLPQVDILLAGLPCTGASLSGKSKNRISYAEEHETAGALFVALLNIVQASQPSVVLLENVLPYQQTLSYRVIGQVLEKLGYQIYDAHLQGNELGALEARERLCMVATTQGVMPVEPEKVTPVRHKEATVADILETVPLDSPRWKSYDYLKAKEDRDKAAGKGFRRQLLTGEESSLGTIGRGYNKARSTEPFVAHPTDEALSRLLTPREHARAKTVPESLIAGLSDTVAHEILGNSVIHAAFEAVGRQIGETLQASVRQPGIAA